MEISQRVVMDIADIDKRQITALVDSMRHLVDELNKSYRVMQDFSKLAEENQAVNIITESVIDVGI